MTSFKRTISGLNNQHLFHNVDLVVFVEGGDRCYTKSEIYTGSFNDETNDILFWKNIFQRFRNTEKIKFKSVGSKSTLKDIAFDIIDGNITTVMVAMDAEFDEVLHQKLEHSNIIYTRGYSWENDVWSEYVLQDIIQELSAVKVYSADLDVNFKKFLKHIKPAVIVDGYLFSKGQSLFKRPKGYMSVIDCDPTDLPCVKRQVIGLAITNKGTNRGTAYSFARRKRINVRLHCFGHLLADYCFQVIMHYLKKRLHLPGLHKEIIYRMGINKFFQNHFESSETYLYYQNLLG